MKVILGAVGHWITKYVYGLVFVLGFGLIGTSTFLYKNAQKLGAVREQNVTLTSALKVAKAQSLKDAQLLANRSKEKLAIARELSQTRLDLDRALAAQAEWANQPVPKEVQDALAVKP